MAKTSRSLSFTKVYITFYLLPLKDILKEFTPCTLVVYILNVLENFQQLNSSPYGHILPSGVLVSVFIGIDNFRT